eukprot:UN00725
MSTFKYPDFYQFPPFFTLQTAPTTRQKQLDLWTEFVTQYCSHHKVQQIQVNTAANAGSPTAALFNNTTINRTLSEKDIVAVLDAVAANGYGMWLQQDKTSFGLSAAVKLTELANQIYKWADDYGLMDTISTLDEIATGSSSVGTKHYQLPLPVLRAAINELAKDKRAFLYEGDDLASLGIKFVSQV